MSKKKKIILWSVAGVFLVGLVGFVIVALNFGKIAKTGFEVIGSELLGVPVTVRAVFLSPFSGRGGVYGLKIGNPKGYDAEYFLHVKSINIAVDLKTLTQNPIHIKSVDVNSADVNWEGNFSTSNLSTIQNNIKRYAGSSDSQVKVVIDKLRIEETEASVKFAGTVELTVKIDEIEKDGIGAKTNGVSYQVVSDLVFSEMGSAILSTLRSSPELIGSGIIGVGEGVVGVGTGAVDGVVGGVKSLFGD